MSTRLSAEPRKKIYSFCYWCSKKDVDANLVSGRTYRATKLTTKSNHVKNVTAKWIEMAAKLNNESALRLLSSGDVVSNELYYHNKCYATIQYQYSKLTKSESSKSVSMGDTECKQIALKKVIFYLKGSEISSPKNVYPLMELKAMYSDRLKSDSIHHYNHSATFAMYPV